MRSCLDAPRLSRLRLGSWLLGAAMLVLLAASAPGRDARAQPPQTPAAQPPQAPARDKARPGYRGEERNPFALTSVILERTRKGQAAVGFQPAEGPVKVPDLKLRGIVVRSDGSKAALLEVKGRGTYVVREGDRIGLNPAQASAAIRVTRINRMQVEVEVGSIRQVIIVR